MSSNSVTSALPVTSATSIRAYPSAHPHTQHIPAHNDPCSLAKRSLYYESLIRSKITMHYTRSMARAARAAARRPAVRRLTTPEQTSRAVSLSEHPPRTTSPGTTKDSGRISQNDGEERNANDLNQGFPLLKLPPELRHKVLEYAAIDSSVHLGKRSSSVHLDKRKIITYHIICPFSGVCRQIEAELERVLQKHTPSSWQQAKKITVDVHNLDFSPIVDFLDSLTRKQIDTFKANGTKIIPKLRFGRCPRRFEIARRIKEEDLLSLVSWLGYTIDPKEKRSSLSNWACEFVIKDPEITVEPWVRTMNGLIHSLRTSASGAMLRPGTLGLRRQIGAIVDTGVEALIAARAGK